MVGAAVSATECEPIVRRLNTFLSVPEVECDGGGDDTDGGVDVTVRLVDAALVYKSNGSFKASRAPSFALPLLKAAPASDVDADLSTDRGVEMHCGDIVGFLAPPTSTTSEDFVVFERFPFAREFAPRAFQAPSASRRVGVSSHDGVSRAHRHRDGVRRDVRGVPSRRYLTRPATPRGDGRRRVRLRRRRRRRRKRTRLRESREETERCFARELRLERHAKRDRRRDARPRALPATGSGRARRAR